MRSISGAVVAFWLTLRHPGIRARSVKAHAAYGAMPPRRKPAQTAPKPAGPTGSTNGEAADLDSRAQSGKYLTTAQGLRMPDTDHSLKAGERGPSLLEDFHLREKNHPLRSRADP
jgi:hypothetical protein